MQRAYLYLCTRAELTGTETWKTRENLNIILLHCCSHSEAWGCWTCRGGIWHWCQATYRCMCSGNGGGMGVPEGHFHPHKQRYRCNIPTKFFPSDSGQIVQYNFWCTMTKCFGWKEAGIPRLEVPGDDERITNLIGNIRRWRGRCRLKDKSYGDKYQFKKDEGEIKKKKRKEKMDIKS